MDQTVTIRASVHDTERTLMISVALVILVVFLFLRNVRTTLIPSVAVPVSLIGTFGVMYLCGFSLDNLSLMALTISTGFVVDDAIVVIENITRYLEQGMRPFEAALKGAKEIGFTVVTISVSLVAVFIPLLLMGGVVGRLFREFAITLSVAIAVSMLVSLTTTPMMCAYLLKQHAEHGRIYQPDREDLPLERGYVRAHADRRAPLLVRHPDGPAGHHRAQRLPVHSRLEGLLPATGQRAPDGRDPGGPGHVVPGDGRDAAQDGRYRGRRSRRRHGERLHRRRHVNTARMFVSLKPLAERGITVDEVIARLRPKLSRIPGGTLFLQASQDIRVGGRMSNAQYQYTMRGDNLDDLAKFAPADAAGTADRAADRRRQQRSAEPRPAGAASSTTARPPRASASHRS